MQRVSILPIAIAAILVIGCQRNESPAKPSPQLWERPTKIESALEEPGFQVVSRTSDVWMVKPSSEPKGSASVLGIVAFTYRGGSLDTTRGLLIGISGLQNVETCYVDLDEIPAAIECIDNLSQGHRAQTKPDSGGDSMDFRTKGGLLFRAYGAGTKLIGIQKFGGTRGGANVLHPSDADLAELKMKLELARQWAEKQTP